MTTRKVMIKRNGLIWAGFFSILLTTTISTSMAAPTEQMSGNVTATSTYIWRGLPQTSEAALQGGVQADLEKNVYVGGWTSTVTGGSEVDIYGGYKGKADIFNYDAGVIYYFYPNEPEYDSQTADLSFFEVYLDVSRDFYGAKVSISSDAGNYLEGYATMPLEHWTLGLHIGRYAIEEDYHGFLLSDIKDDFFDYKLSLGKDVGGFDVEFALTDTNLSGDAGDFRTAISVSKDFTP